MSSSGNNLGKRLPRAMPQHITANMASAGGAAGIMYRFNNTILITLVGWFGGTCLYAVYWVGAALAQPDLATYERGGFLALLGFVVYRLPHLLTGLLIIIVLELLVFLYRAVKHLQ